MKKYILAVVSLALVSSGAALGQKKALVTVTDYKIQRVGPNVEATISLTSPKSGRGSYKITALPAIAKGGNVVGMPDVVFRTTKGRILDFRHDVQYPASTIFAKPGEVVQYTYQFPYKAWMNHSELLVGIRRAGCARQTTAPVMTVAQHLNLPPDTAYIVRPSLAYQAPAAERKARTEIGSAFLEFPDGSSKLIGNFRNNAHELAKINSSITMVSSDRENKTLDGIEIWGTCSPEGSFALNSRLAQGRAEALQNYLMQNYPNATSNYKVTSTPENWAGLAAILADNPESWATAVIQIANSDISDDAKDRQVRQLDHGLPYRYMLKELYPQLRRVDYRVNYSIRDYTPAEVAQIYKTRPGDLSLAELFALGRNFSSGSVEFGDIILKSVALYPESAVANLNAATLMLERGDLVRAKDFLARGRVNSGYYYNTLGVVQLLDGDYEGAYVNLQRAEGMGVTAAGANLRELGLKLQSNAVLSSQGVK